MLKRQHKYWQIAAWTSQVKTQLKLLWLYVIAHGIRSRYWHRAAHLEVYRHNVIKRIYLHCRTMVPIYSEAFNIPKDPGCGSQVFSVCLNTTFTGLANTTIENWPSVSWRSITLLQHSKYLVRYQTSASIVHSPCIWCTDWLCSLGTRHYVRHIVPFICTIRFNRKSSHYLHPITLQKWSGFYIYLVMCSRCTTTRQNGYSDPIPSGCHGHLRRQWLWEIADSSNSTVGYMYSSREERNQLRRFAGACNFFTGIW